MPLASFYRARHFARRTGGLTVAIYLLSALLALLFVGLILVTGLLVELFVSAGEGEIDRASPLARWIDAGARTSDGRLVVDRAGLIPWAARLKGTAWENVAFGLVERFAGLRGNVTALALLVTWGLGLAIVYAIALFLHERAVLAKAAQAIFELRQAIYAQAYQLGGGELAGGPNASAADLFAERIESLRFGLVAWWRTIPRMVLLALVLVTIAATVHVWLAVAAMLMALVGWTIYSWCESWTRQQRALWGDRAAQQMSLLLESLGNVRLVRGLALSDPPGQPVADTLGRHRRAVSTRDLSESLLDPLAVMLILTTSIAVLAMGGANILRHPPWISMAALTVLYLSLVSAWYPVRRIYRLGSVVRRASGAATAVFSFLDREPKIGQLPQAVGVRRLQKSLAFEAVTLSDATGRRLLDEVSFEIPAGSTAAIVCSEGNASRAVASLLGRFSDPAAGRILYDGQELRGVTLDSLHRQLVLVMQSDWTFTGSVADNVSCGDRQYTPQQVLEMARRVHVHDAIQRLPHGFATIIGEHGLRLPALASWRIALARALLRDPAVVVIEEPNAELDGDTPPGIDETLRQFVRQRTAIFLPARLSTLRGVDRVFVLHEGKLHASGTHAELLEASELYRHWNYVRFNPFRR